MRLTLTVTVLPTVVQIAAIMTVVVVVIARGRRVEPRLGVGRLCHPGLGLVPTECGDIISIAHTRQHGLTVVACATNSREGTGGGASSLPYWVGWSTSTSVLSGLSIKKKKK